MTLGSRSGRWAATLALGLAGLVGLGAVTVLAAPSAPTAASTFELTLQARDTMQFEDDVILPGTRQGTFRSRAPFCGSGTFDEPGFAVAAGRRSTWLFTCEDGTGSVAVSIESWYPGAQQWGTTWRILDGSGSHAGLRGKGSLEGEVLSTDISESGSVVTWRSSLQGVADRDAAAPTIAFSKTKATKLPRPAGAYVLKLGLLLRDNDDANSISYTLRLSTARGAELARRFGTARAGAVPMTLRIRPPAGARTVRLALTGVDPVGNATSIRRAVRLPR